MDWLAAWLGRLSSIVETRDRCTFVGERIMLVVVDGNGSIGCGFGCEYSWV
jgi:hypothetical protein